MPLNNFNSNGFDADQARYERENRMNPSEYPPGQGMGSMDSLFSNDISQPIGDGMNGGEVMNNSFQQNTGSMNMNGMNGQGNSFFQGMPNQQPMQPQKSEEDMFFDGLKKGGLATVDFLSDIVKSFGQVTTQFWCKWGYNTLITSAIVAGSGFVLRLVGLRIGMRLMQGGVLAAIPSVGAWLFLTGKSRNNSSLYKEDNVMSEPEVPIQEEPPASESTSFFQDITDARNNFSEPVESFDMEEEEEEEDWDEFSFEGDDDDWDFSGFVEEEPQAGVDFEEALDSMTVLDKGMYTRQYLYEMFTKVLPTICSSFATMKEYDEDDDTFLYWDEKLREAATVTGVKEDFLPSLYELSENLFTVKLVCDRPTGFKPEAVAQELANIYAFQEGVDAIAFKVEPVGMQCYITLYTGKTTMISLRDMYKVQESYILNTDNKMPVVIGITTSGEVKVADFKKIESAVIAGMPRKGKSWYVQNILYQLCSYMPPSELNIYICDPKDGISDYKPFVLPHVKGFESDDTKVIELLRKIVKVEAPRRKKIIGDANHRNIWSFRKQYPDVKMPLIYVVIDEIVTFASRMDKDTHHEFRMILRELISQLPALGIRVILIPHILNNDIVEKKTSDLINFKVSVCGDADHVEKTTGAKPRQFTHRLTNLGDMAVRLPEISESVMFIHAPVLTPDNTQSAQLFDYARRVWAKLEPESVSGSVAEKAEIAKEQEDLLNKMKVDSTMEDEIIKW